MKNNLKKYREKHCFTQQQIAKIANIPVRSYQNYENGNREPKTKIAIKLAKILKTTVEELF